MITDGGTNRRTQTVIMVHTCGSHNYDVVFDVILGDLISQAAALHLFV